MTSSETGFPCALRTENRSCCALDEVERAVGERPVRLELPAQVTRRVAHGEPRVGGPRVAYRAIDDQPGNSDSREAFGSSDTSITTFWSLCSARYFHGVTRP